MTRKDVPLASRLAHALETPLLSLELELRKLLRSERTRPAAERCLDEVETMKSLVTGVLRLPEPRLDLRRFSLAGVFERAQKRFSSIARDRDIRLECTPSRLEALGDREATEQILSNLLSNAVRFSERGGRVSLEAITRDETVVVEVRDRGVGIAAEECERIFEPFVRLDPELPGSGLGLAIARSLAEAQHGSLRVESLPGEGSTFRLTLPAR